MCKHSVFPPLPVFSKGSLKTLFFFLCLGFSSCLVPPKNQNSSHSWIPKAHKAIQQLYIPHEKKKGASSLKTIYLHLPVVKRPLFHLMVTPHLENLALSKKPPPAAVLSLLAKTKKKKALPILIRATKNSLDRGYSAPFVTGSLEISLLTVDPKRLIHGLVVAEITGFSMDRARKTLKKYSLKQLQKPLREALKQGLPSLHPLFASYGFTTQHTRTTIEKTLWKTALSLGCIENTQPLHDLSSNTLEEVLLISQKLSLNTNGLHSLLAVAKNLRSSPLKASAIYMEVGWSPVPSPSVSKKLTDELIFLSQKGLQKNTEKVLARALLLSLIRVGEPQDQKRLSTLNTSLPSSLVPLLRQVLSTLEALHTRNETHLFNLCKSKKPYLVERAVLELGRKKICRKKIQSLSTLPFVHDYPLSVGKALNRAKSWQ